MLKKFKIVENIALIFVAILIGIIVSFFAQLFMYVVQVVFNFLFFNETYELKILLGEYSLNLAPLLICIPASILVGFILYISKLPRWYGPADTIFAAHTKAGTLDLKGGFTSTLASFISICGGASVVSLKFFCRYSEVILKCVLKFF